MRVFHNLLLTAFSIKQVIVCQALVRMSAPFEGYNDCVQVLNNYLSVVVINDHPGATFWKYRFFFN